jgi:hypothetical protein
MVGLGCAKGTQASPGLCTRCRKRLKHTHPKHAQTKAQATPHIRAAAKTSRIRFGLNSCCIQHSTFRALCYFGSSLASLPLLSWTLTCPEVCHLASYSIFVLTFVYSGSPSCSSVPVNGAAVEDVPICFDDNYLQPLVHRATVRDIPPEEPLVVMSLSAFQRNLVTRNDPEEMASIKIREWNKP